MAANANGMDDTRLIDLKVNLNTIFGTESQNLHLNRPTPTFNCVFGNQNISLTGDVQIALQNGKHCEAVSVFFLSTCDLSVDDCTTECRIEAEEEICSLTANIEPTECWETKFAIRDNECANEFEFQQKYDMKFAEKLAAMDQEGEIRAIGKFQEWAEDLSDVEVGTGGLSADNSVWEIPKSEWNAELMVELQCVIEDCEMVNPLLVLGKAFRKDMMLAAAKQGGGCCDYNSLYGSINSCSNPRLLDKQVGVTSAFIVDVAKVGYFNRWIHTSTSPVRQNDQYDTVHYRINSQKLQYRLNGSLQPVIYDVYEQRHCVSEDIYETRVKIKHRGGFACLPDNCVGEYPLAANKKVIQIAQDSCAGC